MSDDPNTETKEIVDKQKRAPKLNEGQVEGEIVNDSLGTVDPADTADTDPADDAEASGTGPKGSEA